MLDEKILDRARRLIKNQFGDRRKILPNEISQIGREMQIKGMASSSVTLKKIHTICAQEVTKRAEIVWESVVRAHKAMGAPLTKTLAADIIRATVAAIAQEAQLIPEPATIFLLTLGGLIFHKSRRP